MFSERVCFLETKSVGRDNDRRAVHPATYQHRAPVRAGRVGVRALLAVRLYVRVREHPHRAPLHVVALGVELRGQRVPDARAFVEGRERTPWLQRERAVRRDQHQERHGASCDIANRWHRTRETRYDRGRDWCCASRLRARAKVVGSSVALGDKPTGEGSTHRSWTRSSSTTSLTTSSRRREKRRECTGKKETDSTQAL